jgi:hypothetical protein
MATKITIGNKTTAIPGVYAQIKSGIVNPSTPLDFGNVVIIDDGTFASDNYIACNGVNGANKSGLDSVIEITDPALITSQIWDSELVPVLKSLFKPTRRQGSNGTNKVYYLQAATTVAATAAFPFVKGTLTLKSKFEGVSLNGYLVTKTYDVLFGGGAYGNGLGLENLADATSTELSKGLAVRLENGRAYGYSLAFYRGVHDKMADPLNQGYGFNETALPDPTLNVLPGTYNVLPPTLLFRSPDFKRLSELNRWLTKSPDFRKWFSVTSFPFDPNDDAVTNADITTNQTALIPYKVFAGGTTTFGAQDFTDALTAAKSLDNTFFLSLKSGDDADGINNTAVFNLLTSDELKWDKYQFVPGYGDSDSFLGDVDTTEYLTKYYNNQHVIVTHGLAKVANTQYPDGYRNISVLEKTAKLLGRVAGLPPQTPLTFKDIAIDAEIHKLTEPEKEAGIAAGILMTAYNSELSSFVVVAGINTLGNNDFLVNTDASSYDIAVERIKSQLNKELIYFSTQAFFGTDKGANRGTVTPEDIGTWLKSFLNQRTASDNKDNLIIRQGAITVTVDQDNYFVTYEFVPNYPINKIVFTGIMLGA